MHRQRRKQRAVLEQHAEPHVEPQPLGLARLVEVDAEQLDRAGLLAVEAEDGAQQHRLAGARAPTKPRISPRMMSSDSLSSTILSPKATVMSRTDSTISLVRRRSGRSHRRSAAASLIAPSEIDRRVEHGEQAVEDDDDEDRLHHRSGDVLAERFGAAADLQAFDRSR